jgi:hypothetical protein
MEIKYSIFKNHNLTILFLLMSLAVHAGSDAGKKIESGSDIPITADVPGDARWIWYPGDFDIWLHTLVGGRRQERAQPYPPFWRVDAPYALIKFDKVYELDKPEKIKIFADGRYHVRIDGRVAYDFDPMNFELPAGRHRLNFLVENYETFPSLLVQGKTVYTDESWQVTNQNLKFYNAAAGKFADPSKPPSTFSLEYTPVQATVLQRDQNSMLVDFGKETFGKVIVKRLAGEGMLTLFYGETREEALAGKEAETYDFIDVDWNTPVDHTTETRAFRYIYAVGNGNVSFDQISALYEYLPVDYRGDFECSDELLNKIYEVSLYTLHLNTREFHLDGIKRDRWIWSGDAYQSYLMNFYTFFDEDVNKRTLYALRGHDPVETHINTILDYSFYWMMGIYDHFFYTGDTAFVEQIYPRMKTMLEFCLGRTNDNGFVEGLPGDWVFIDWAEIDKKGEVSFEQLLLARSLEAVALCAAIAGDDDYAVKCNRLSESIKTKVFDTFWNDAKGAFVHNRINGILSGTVTRYANMFSILFGYADDDKKQKIRDNVILNDDILKITTPYMKFYELASLCEIGEEEKAIQFVRDYWGGMLDLGATSIWEAYDPEQSGDEHYAMYGRPFGKSLCHAWGANPVYLFGKYLMGVKPTAPGYRSYIIEPSLAGLQWMKGKVPTPNGDIEFFMDQKEITLKTVPGEGILRIVSKRPPKADKGVQVISRGNDAYDIILGKPATYNVRYW